MDGFGTCGTIREMGLTLVLRTLIFGGLSAGAWPINERVTGCDINLIEVFDLHWYKCDDDASWNDPAVERDPASDAQGTPVGGIFAQTREDLIKSIMKHDSEMDGWGRNEHTWTEWVNARPFWVSETSCEWDREGRDDHSNIVSCQKQTGQYSHDGAVAGSEHGEGSIAGVLDPSTSVERWSWWTTMRV